MGIGRSAQSKVKWRIRSQLINLLRKLNEGTETPLHVGLKNEALGVYLGMGSLELSGRNEGSETPLHVGLKNEALGVDLGLGSLELSGRNERSEILPFSPKHRDGLQ